MLEQYQTNLIALHFDSIDEMVERVEPGQNKARSEGCETLPLSDTNWVGRKFKSLADFAESARGEWAEGLEIIDRMASSLGDSDLPKPQSRRRVPCFREGDGDEICFDRLAARKPFWRSTYRANRSGLAIVPVVIDIGAPWFVPSLDLFWRGAAGIVLAKRLEEAGYRVDLFTATTALEAVQSGETILTSMQAKRSNDTIDMGALATAVSGWFFRLAHIGQYATVGRVSRGHGYHPQDKVITPDQIKLVTGGRAAIMANGIWNERDALAWVRKHIELVNSADGALELEVA